MSAEPAVVPPLRQAGATRVLVSAGEGGRSSVVEGLHEQGLAVLVPPPGVLLQQVERGGFDLVVVHLPQQEALAELHALREVSAVPVVVALLEARTSLEVFLEAGADDCVVSGVPRSELAARVRAVLRRHSRPVAGEVLRAGPLVMDLARHVFLHGDAAVHLSPKEFGLLELLLRRDGRVVSRGEALEQVWGRERGGDATTVDVHVKRIRSKIERDPARPELLLTVRGLGYRVET